MGSVIDNYSSYYRKFRNDICVLVGVVRGISLTCRCKWRAFRIENKNAGRHVSTNAVGGIVCELLGETMRNNLCPDSNRDSVVSAKGEIFSPTRRINFRQLAERMGKCIIQLAQTCKKLLLLSKTFCKKLLYLCSKTCNKLLL